MAYNYLYVEDVKLAGFDMSRAIRLPPHLRETVREYLGALAADLPRQWLGNQVLDDLWERSAAASRRSARAEASWMPLRIAKTCNPDLVPRATDPLWNPTRISSSVSPR